MYDNVQPGIQITAQLQTNPYHHHPQLRHQEVIKDHSFFFIFGFEIKYSQSSHSNRLSQLVIVGVASLAF